MLQMFQEGEEAEAKMEIEQVQEQVLHESTEKL